VGLAVAAAATLAVGSGLHIGAAVLAQFAVYLGAAMLMGIAIGALFLASAPAIVLYYVLPIGWSILGSWSKLHGAAVWLDSGRTLAPLIERTVSAQEWARIGTSLAVWIALPLALGAVRILRSDVRV
jgi:ABC-2 type transport system permease protein